MGKKLRWKREDRLTGLSSIGAPPRGYKYHDGTDEYASIYANGGNWQKKQNGWYWVAFDKVPYKNTCDQPCPDVETAKKEASEYVKRHLQP